MCLEVYELMFWSCERVTSFGVAWKGHWPGLSLNRMDIFILELNQSTDRGESVDISMEQSTHRDE